MSDLYSVSAKYYDEAYATLEDLRDLQFYLGMTLRTGRRYWNSHAAQAACYRPLRNRDSKSMAWTVRQPCSINFSRNLRASRSTFVS